jgi:hypothetical protein
VCTALPHNNSTTATNPNLKKRKLRCSVLCKSSGEKQVWKPEFNPRLLALGHPLLDSASSPRPRHTGIGIHEELFFSWNLEMSLTMPYHQALVCIYIWCLFVTLDKMILSKSKAKSQVTSKFSIFNLLFS